MNTYLKVVAVLVLIFLDAFFYFNRTALAPTITESGIKGCYVAHLAKDVYSLKISSQDGDMVEGTLVFKNFEKDSSSGTFKGTYANEILLGDYSFQSEGTYSVMQVVFKKSGNAFVRGYGETTEGGTRFADVNKLTYDQSYVFEPVAECATSL